MSIAEQMMEEGRQEGLIGQIQLLGLRVTPLSALSSRPPSEVQKLAAELRGSCANGALSLSREAGQRADHSVPIVERRPSITWLRQCQLRQINPAVLRRAQGFSTLTQNQITQ